MGNVVCGSCLSPDGCKNLFCIGKEPCKPCYCLLGEEHRVGRVFDHFEGQPVSAATKQAGQLRVYVGRVTLPDNPQQIDTSGAMENGKPPPDRPAPRCPRE